MKDSLGGRFTLRGLQKRVAEAALEGRVEHPWFACVSSGPEQVHSDQALIAAATRPGAPEQRFTLAANGKGFLATVLRSRMDLWILDDFASPKGWLDWFFRR